MRRFVISELSMEPTLLPGDAVLARALRRPVRGKIVFFEHPHRPGFWLVKRLLGLPGEAITIAKGLLLVNGEPVQDWSDETTAPAGTWDVPDDAMFVISDARTRTLADSRTLGAVPLRGAYTPIVRYRRSRT